MLGAEIVDAGLKIRVNNIATGKSMFSTVFM